jgi:hypothetical protein
MTSYIAITDAETDPEAPITSELAKKWRDNPIAIGEADSTVPAGLLPTVLLGTLTTTSGSTQTLSSLTLTPYKFLVLVFNDVSHNSASVNKGVFITSTSTNSLFTIPNTSDRGNGLTTVDLATGVYSGSFDAGTAGRVATGGNSSLSTASTSVTITVGANTFDFGSVRIYGVK